MTFCKNASKLRAVQVEMKKQIPSAPARRARRHALSSFDQLNEAERERLGKINPLHKRYVVRAGACCSMFFLVV